MSTSTKQNALLTALAVSTIWILLVSGCAPPRVVVALKEERIKVGLSSAAVIAQAGPPVMWIAKDSVETIYYRNGKQGVYISFLDDKVVAYDDRAEWPEAAWRGLAEAKRSKTVGTGRIRVGMPEAKVLEILGKPDGLTAESGVETFHWVSNKSSDSVVEMKEGKVVGYLDMETNKFTQNIPSHDRKNSTTAGRIRVGMTKQAVQDGIGKPDSVSAKEGLVVHRYDSKSFWANDLVYMVEYKEDRVVGFSQSNLTLAKKERKAKRDAERAEQEASEEDSGPSRARRFFGFLFHTAVQEALSRRDPGRGGRVRTRDCSCPERFCGRFKISGCTARCPGKLEPVCRCQAVCTGSSMKAINKCYCR
ncbi:MAG: hypothetical protein RBU30_05385 [Polyangia bacterium]|nr:hypothetical protein [Polyangia bacterium]